MKLRKEYRAKRVFTQVSPYVHKRLNSAIESELLQTDPPMPPREMGKGWPIWILEHQGGELIFASPEEMAHVADVLGRKILPRPWQLHDKAGYANAHWLSRLHTSWRGWDVRQRVVACLRAGL